MSKLLKPNKIIRLATTEPNLYFSNISETIKTKIFYETFFQTFRFSWDIFVHEALISKIKIKNIVVYTTHLSFFADFTQLKFLVIDHKFFVSFLKVRNFKDSRNFERKRLYRALLISWRGARKVFSFGF